MRVAILFPHSPGEPNNSGVARLEMFNYMRGVQKNRFHFGKKTKPSDVSVGKYFPEADPRILLSLLRLMFSFAKQHRRHNYQAIWTTLPPIIMAVFASLLSRLYKLPLVVDVRDPGIASVLLKFDQSSFQYRVAHIVEGWIYQTASAITVTTPELEELLVKEFRLGAEKITVISNATSFKKRKPVKLDKKIIAVYAGSFAKYQVLDKLLTSINDFRQSKDNVEFVLYGFDSRKHFRLSQYVKDKNLASLIKLRKPIPRLRLFQVMQQAHIVIVPIYFDGYKHIYDYAVPLKFYEAIGVSRPILLFGGTRASTNLLKSLKVGLACGMRQNVFRVLTKIKKHYGYYQANAAKAVFSRKKAGEKLERILLSLTSHEN